MTIDNFRHYSNGVLPFKGNLLDQPSKLVEAYGLIETFKIEYENDLRDRQIKAQKRKS
jgi:hypothetical protein